MSVKTTLNINDKVLEQIESISESSGKTRSEIIIMLLMKVMSHDYTKARLKRSVQYQKRDSNLKLKPVHIRYNYDEYEYFLDLRKILKMSVSYILAYAVKKYHHTILNNKNSDNNTFKNYILSLGMSDGVIFWKLYWGIPEHLQEIIRQE